MSDSPKARVLIVDDAGLVRAYYRDILERAGYEIEEAFNGVEALEKLLQSPVDFVIVDINMPKMDGIAVLKKLRAEPKTKDIPIILLTNLYDNEKLVEASQYGVYDYLIKSDWKIEDVVKKVKEKLRME